MRTCRFCLESGHTARNPLISPCECKGSVQFVHKTCLVRWAKMDPDQNARICTICKYPFTINLLPDFENMELGTALDRILLEHYTIIAIGLHYFAMTFYLDIQHLEAFPDAFYKSTLLSNLLSHFFYAQIANKMWRVKNKVLYWELFLRSRFFYLGLYHIGLLGLCVLLKNGLLGTLVHILWNTYWREHLLLLGKVNEVLREN